MRIFAIDGSMCAVPYVRSSRVLSRDSDSVISVIACTITSVHKGTEEIGLLYGSKKPYGPQNILAVQI